MKARIEAEQVTGGVDNELGRRRTEKNLWKPGDPIEPDARRFETVFERVHWILCEARHRALTLEEQDYLAWYKREHPKSYRGVVDLVEARFGAPQHGPAAAG